MKSQLVEVQKVYEVYRTEMDVDGACESPERERSVERSVG